MKKQKKSELNTLKEFKKVFEQAAYFGGYESTFNDFLTMCIYAFARNPLTGLSYYEDEYMELMGLYQERGVIEHFPHLLAILVAYMEEHKDSTEGNDLLGTFYEQEVSHGRNGQYFTPFPICHLMASITDDDKEVPRSVLDPSCGSGRMLMAYSKRIPLQSGFYGIDLDPSCVKMTAINLFLNGRSGEVMRADALTPDDFKFAYRVSHQPLGIFKIEKREDSRLWHMNQKIPNRTKKRQLRLF